MRIDPTKPMAVKILESQTQDDGTVYMAISANDHVFLVHLKVATLDFTYTKDLPKNRSPDAHPWDVESITGCIPGFHVLKSRVLTQAQYDESRKNRRMSDPVYDVELPKLTGWEG